jgi:hypothetical protein
MTTPSRLCLVLACFLFGCPDPDPGSDSGPPGEDSGPAVCGDEIPSFEAGDEGSAAPLEVGEGEVRAGVLAEADLPIDRTGLATWAEGDFVIASDRAALIIEDAGDSDLYDPHGGRPVGIALVDQGSLVEAGDFSEAIFGFSGFLVRTESVSVVNDGSDGNPAVVRAIGTLGRLEFVGELLTTFLGNDDYTGYQAAMDYEMAPGSDAVDIYLSIRNETTETARAQFLVSAFFQNYRMPRWTELNGFGPAEGDLGTIAFVDDTAASYAWSPAEGESLSQLIDISGVQIYTSDRPTVAPCSVARLHLGTLVIGGPGLSGLQLARARHAGETLRTITGAVLEADGSPATGVRVHLLDADGGHFARAVVNAAGEFEIAAPAEDVTLVAWRTGEQRQEVAVPAGTNTAMIELEAFGTIDVTALDTNTNEPAPARVQVIPVTPRDEPPSSFGELVYPNGRSHVAFTVDGRATLRVEPGDYHVIVSRGYEYELASTDNDGIAVAEDTVVPFTVELERVVDTTGVMCADYHIHTHRSPDSPDAPDLKLRGLIADGLEIPIRSDHEWINDFQPLIEARDLTQYAFGIGGEELTTFAWGHFGVFPVNQDENAVNGSAISWVGRLPPAVFADVRARPEQPVLIINHPRSGGRLGGYFNAAGFDPTTGMVGYPDHWDEDFTIVEVFNDGDFDRFRDETVRDWFGLLAQGRRVFAIGSSDSHSIQGSPVGYPRTCLALGIDDPTMLNANMVRDATRDGHSTISGGIYLTVVGPDGSGPGDDVEIDGTTATFDVTVQAASWIEGIDRLEVIVDGESVETISITEADRDPLLAQIRFRADIEVDVAAAGSWVVFHAGTSEGSDLAPVHPGRRAFAVSNPVFVSR